jgi:UDP-N-acetylglucosamine acyltransferase
MAKIHPTAIIDAKAELADDVTVGAYAIIKGSVRIGSGGVVLEHSHIQGTTVIGKNCRIGPGAYVGMDPQHLKYAGAETRLMIGDDFAIRETATVHRSFYSDPEKATRIGDRCYMMCAAHVAHDCQLGNDVIMANSVLLGGHVTVGDRAFLGGGFAIHQFCRIGRLAMVAGMEAVSQDIPPFSAVRDQSLKGYNAVGCRRAGIAPQSIVAIRAAFRCFRKNRLMSDAINAIRAEVPLVPEVVEIIDFIAASKRGMVPSIVALRSRRSAPVGDEGLSA